MKSEIGVHFLKGMAPELSKEQQKSVFWGAQGITKRCNDKKEHSVLNGLKGVKNGWRKLVSKD